MVFTGSLFTGILFMVCMTVYLLVSSAVMYTASSCLAQSSADCCISSEFSWSDLILSTSTYSPAPSGSIFTWQYALFSDAEMSHFFDCFFLLWTHTFVHVKVERDGYANRSHQCLTYLNKYSKNSNIMIVTTPAAKAIVTPTAVLTVVVELLTLHWHTISSEETMYYNLANMNK